MATVPELFGKNVFDDRQMKARLPEKVYNSIRKTIEEGKQLDISLANAVAYYLSQKGKDAVFKVKINEIKQSTRNAYINTFPMRLKTFLTFCFVTVFISYFLFASILRLNNADTPCASLPISRDIE